VCDGDAAKQHGAPFGVRQRTTVGRGAAKEVAIGESARGKFSLAAGGPRSASRQSTTELDGDGGGGKTWNAGSGGSGDGGGGSGADGGGSPPPPHQSAAEAR